MYFVQIPLLSLRYEKKREKNLISHCKLKLRNKHTIKSMEGYFVFYIVHIYTILSSLQTEKVNTISHDLGSRILNSNEII